jgi:hypothetical protein
MNVLSFSRDPKGSAPANEYQALPYRVAAKLNSRVNHFRRQEGEP